MGISCIADRYGIGIADLLFVGDEEKDHKTAMNAGCDFMFIDDYLKLKAKCPEI